MLEMNSLQGAGRSVIAPYRCGALSQPLYSSRPGSRAQTRLGVCQRHEASRLGYSVDRPIAPYRNLSLEQ